MKIYSNGSTSFASMSTGEILIDAILLIAAIWLTVRIAKA